MIHSNWLSAAAAAVSVAPLRLTFAHALRIEARTADGGAAPRRVASRTKPSTASSARSLNSRSGGGSSAAESKFASDCQPPRLERDSDGSVAARRSSSSRSAVLSGAAASVGSACT